MDVILMVALMGAALYFLMIRPQQKRAKEQQNLLNSLQPGSRVMTVSGILGTVKHVGQKQVILEVSPDVEMTVVKAAISTQPVEDEFEYADEPAELPSGAAAEAIEATPATTDEQPDEGRPATPQN